MNIEGIISHSMGGAAILNLDQAVLESKKIILISSPVSFFEDMVTKITGMGIHRKVLDNLLEDASSTHKKEWQTLAPKKHQHKLSSNFLVIHDEEDRFCSFKNMEDLLEDTEASLVRTSGLGHRRVLRDRYVFDSILNFLGS
jgi:hypothetical protein